MSINRQGISSCHLTCLSVSKYVFSHFFQELLYHIRLKQRLSEVCYLSTISGVLWVKSEAAHIHRGERETEESGRTFQMGRGQI